MATTTHRVSTTSTSNTTSYASGSFTPGAGELLLAFVFATNTTATGTMTDSQSLGMTLIASLTASATHRLMVFASNTAAAASSMTVTFDCTGDAATGALIMVAGVSGLSKFAANCLIQSKTNGDAAGIAPNVTFDTTTSDANPTYGFVANLSNPAGLTPPTNWTEGNDTGYSTPTAGGEYVYRDSGFAGTSMTWGSASASVWAAIILELDASSGGSDPLGMRGFFG